MAGIVQGMLFFLLHVCAVYQSKGLEAAETSLGTEQCQSNDAAACSPEGRALLAHRATLERVRTHDLQEGSEKQASLNEEAIHASSERPLNVELTQLTKGMPSKDLENMIQLARGITHQHRQPGNESGNVTDPDELPIFEPAPATPEYQMPHEKETADEAHIFAKYIVVPIAAVFFIVYNVSTLMEKFEITAVPESGVVIGIGMGLGWLMKKYTSLEFFENQEAWAELNTLMLNFMLLPIIIFASGWSLRRHDFYSQLPYILLFAVGGTAVSTCCVAGMMHVTGLAIGWRTAFVYASLISATDPVATLTTYSKLEVEPLLNIMVFGESTINDAVAIVLFKIFNSNDLMEDPATGDQLPLSYKLVGNISWGIFKTFFGSLCFGVALGMLYTVIARFADMRQNKKGQILVIFVSCYLTYGLAETLHFSGIIAVTFTSLIMGVYMRPHLSTEGTVMTTFFVKQIATLADSAVFLVVGVSFVHLSFHGLNLGIYVGLFCLVARLIATVPTAYLVNGLKAARGAAAGQPIADWNLLEPKHIFMMWHAGLRGGIALALAWELGPWVDIVEGKVGYRNSLHSATFLIIIVFLVVFGGSTSACLNYFKIAMGEEYPEDHLSKSETSGLGIRGITHYLDTRVFTPLLIGHEMAKQHKEDEAKQQIDADGDAEKMMKKSVSLHKFCQH